MGEQVAAWLQFGRYDVAVKPGVRTSEAVDPDQAFAVGLNIVAIAMLVYLFRQRSIRMGPTETERMIREWFYRC